MTWVVNVNVVVVAVAITSLCFSGITALSVPLTTSSSSLEPKGCDGGQVSLGGAIPLLLADDSGLNMVLCEAGLRYLREELGEDELYVTSVVGPARKGKSFLLNNLASISQPHPTSSHVSSKSETGFAVGHTAQGHTKGFWLSPKSADNIIESADTGRNVTAIFMDTEGSGATGNFKSYDPKICAIAAIFSSNLIYNVMSEISMDNLDFLAKITLFDHYLTSKKNTSFPSPPLSWAVQNWEFSLDSYNPPNAIGYLQSVLQKKVISENLGTDERKQYEEYNALISAITGKFSPFDYSIPRAIPPIMLFDEPSQQTKKMHLTQLSFSEYDQGYQEQIIHLRQLIRDGAKSKEFSRGKYLTGKSFAQNLETLTVALNQLTHVGDALIKAVAKEAAEISFEDFKTEASLLSRPSLSQSHFDNQLSKLEEKSIRNFQSGCLGGEMDAINKEMQDQLLKDMRSERRVLHELNFNKQIDSCGREASQHIDAIKNISSGQNNKFNKCGLKALVIADSNDNSLVHGDDEDSRSNARRKNRGDASAQKLLQLQRCYDSNIAQYSHICAPDWCDAKAPNAQETCLEPLQRNLLEYTVRSTEAVDVQKKELAQLGFQKLLFSVLLIYVMLYICKKITPSTLSTKIAHINSVLFYCLVSLIALANFQTYKWLQVLACDFFEEWWFLETSTCLYYSNELPNMVGALFNTSRLHYATFLDTLRVLIQHFVRSKDKMQEIKGWSVQGVEWLREWMGVAIDSAEMEPEEAWLSAEASQSPHSEAMRQLVRKLLVVVAVLILSLVLLRRQGRKK